MKTPYFSAYRTSSREKMGSQIQLCNQYEYHIREDNIIYGASRGKVGYYRESSFVLVISPISASLTELWRSFPGVDDGIADSDLDAAGGGARGA